MSINPLIPNTHSHSKASPINPNQPDSMSPNDPNSVMYVSPTQMATDAELLAENIIANATKESKTTNPAPNVSGAASRRALRSVDKIG